LTNVVTVRIHVLARSLEPTQGYSDTKTYTLGTGTMGPFGDGFKRHVFTTTVRLINPAGRRETP
jgi:type IV pilus assembly protein PilW